MFVLGSVALGTFAPGVSASNPNAITGPFNYAEALQKSIYFYDAQKSGPGITGGHLDWRGDSETIDAAVPLKPMAADNTGTNMSQAFITANSAVLDPTHKGTVDLSGGFHDAGDHVKFGLPQGYAASTLGWGYYEFKDAFVSSGQDQHMLEELRWFTDYFLRSTFRNSSGTVVAFAYQVGEGSVDHTVWAPSELEGPDGWNLARPAYFATAETPASDVTAEAAAALAIESLNVQATDPTYAAKCLDYAKALYAFAKQYPSNQGYSGGFYNSSYSEDELSWAAVWLYTATNNMQYITDITAVDASGHYTGYMKKIINSTQDNWQDIWVHSWDTVWGGVFVRLAAAFPTNTTYDYIARWNIEYWSGGSIKHQDTSDTNYLKYTPGGFGVISTWGSARYNTAAQLCALVYAKYNNRTDMEAWAKSQMDYIMGMNPMGYSYIVGFPSPAQAAQHPHHRDSHGSTTDSMTDPATSRHILWGALVGGPDNADVHHDVTTDFVSNEVAIDYSAGMVGALAGLYKYYGAGQQPLANFPPAEPAETAYFDQGKIEQENNQRTQVTIRTNAQPTQPPHYVSGLKARYFFNISEMIAAGQSINNVSVEVYYDEQKSSYKGAAVVNGPIAWDAANGIYYIEIDYSAVAIYGKRDFQFGLVAAQAADYTSHWDPSNDWSHQALTSTALGDTQYIPLYLNGVKVYGQEPPVGGTPSTPVATSTRTNTPAGPSATPTRTSTPVSPSATPTRTPTRTNTPSGPSATPTRTPTRTNTPVGPSATPTRTNTPVGPSATPTRTATRTNTPSGPTATVTPTIASGGLKVQLLSAGTDNTQQTAFNFKVVNTGSSARTNITTRIYFTLDGSQSASNYFLEKYYDQSGAATLTGPTLASGTTYYYTVNFGTATLGAGASWEYQTDLHLVDWSNNYSALNDWWHTAGTLPAAYTDWTSIPAYVSGSLVWGNAAP